MKIRVAIAYIVIVTILKTLNNVKIDKLVAIVNNSNFYIRTFTGTCTESIQLSVSKGGLGNLNVRCCKINKLGIINSRIIKS